MRAAVTCPPAEKSDGPLRLSEIAEALDVPVIILAFQDSNGANRHATYGLERVIASKFNHLKILYSKIKL
jgi:hypothetical protein